MNMITPILDAAVGMLQPICPGLTHDALSDALSRLGNPKEGEPDKLLTRKESAELLRISVQSVDRSIKDHSLKCVKIRGRVLVPMSAVAEKVSGGGNDEL